ncbi:c-type cytochrome [Paenibacillus whitsoniae]|uniref:Cytochrome c n=1 Tax=Paenibacillus whitsoniae TaxID=2496558 RepID=A0A3S0ARN6_9BACL|nr:cytochrome c [Paenibacillus whitsoniae]RTE10999.1 cytochrome c [Paenibacillus whitsoniae]
MKKWGFFALFCFAFALGLGILWERASTHQSDVQQSVNANKMPEGTLDAGAAQTTFKQNCMSCHGAELGGGAGPNLQKVGTKLTDEQIYKKVLSGGGMMPAFKDRLKEDEVANLARWLETHK